MSEFYGDRDPSPSTAPGDDPVLTVRMQPPNTQARRLDLNSIRAVKVAMSADCWHLIDPLGESDVLSATDEEVSGWPIVHPVTIGAAQRLSRPDAREQSAGGHVREVDEDSFPFKTPKVEKR